MSRIGRKPIVLPKNVKISVKENMLSVEGPKGMLEHPLMPKISVEVTDNSVMLKREDDDKETRAYHGLMRAKLANMVKGVSEGFTMDLELVGVGYRAEVQGKDLNFTLGYSHPIKFNLPNGVSAAVDKQTKISLSSIDKELLGQTAANILALRRVDIYKGKGVRKAGQFIKLKPGKTAGKK